MQRLTPFKFQAGQRPNGVEADLMGGVFEAGQLPKRLAADVARQKVVDIVPDGIVRHRAFDDVVIMDKPGAAAADKVQPFIAHAVEFQHAQGGVRRVGVEIDDAVRITAGPLAGLVIAVGAVDPPGEILGVLCTAHFRKFNGGVAAVVEGDGHGEYLANILTKSVFLSECICKFAVCNFSAWIFFFYKFD